MPLEKLKQAVCAANLDLERYGLVHLTFGNVSGLEPQRKLVVIKPSGVAYADLTPDRMVVTDMDGKVVEGDLKPSSDLATHLVLYRRFQSIGGITHTHSRYATMFAQAARPIPCLGTTHADYFNGEIPVTRPLRKPEIERNYEAATGAVIVERFARISVEDMPGVLVLSHGPFTWGATPAKAVEHSAALEEIARMAYGTIHLAPDVPTISPFLLDKHFHRKHGPNSYYGQ